MEKNLFREVYKQVCGLALKDCPPSSLSGLLHGYLSVYSMVRVYPWLEDEYGSLLTMDTHVPSNKPTINPQKSRQGRRGALG